MKIAIISNLYPPFVRGGAEIVASVQAEALKQHWQHVCVISSRPAYKSAGDIDWTGHDLLSIVSDEVKEVEVYRFRPLNLYYYLNDYKYPAPWRLLWHIIDLFNIFSYRQVRHILAEAKPDVVITHNLMGLGFLIPALLRRLKIKHVHVLHDVQLITPSGLIIKNKEKDWRHRLGRALGYIALQKKLWGSPAAVISPSRYLLETYQRAGFFPQSAKYVLPNPVKHLLPLSRDKHEKLEVLYLGQVHKAKGILGLISTWRQLERSDINLHIVGSGQDIGRARQLAIGDKRIVFHGWMEHRSLEPLLRKIDALVVPSLCYENSPTVIYEALSMGLPILAADIGGAAELISDNYNGWTFPAGDWRSLQEKIMFLAEHREELTSLSDNCLESVRPYLVDKYTSRLLEIINHAAQV